MVCKTDGCEGRARSRGKCEACYRRALRAEKKPPTRPNGCRECGRPIKAHGLCRAHYRERRSKRPEGVPTPAPMPGTGNPKIGTPDQGVCTAKTSHDSPGAVVVNGGIRKGDRFQMFGVVCSACHHRWDEPCGENCDPVCVRDRLGWCDSPDHFAVQV
jgi:hypothetical protein